MAAECLCIPTPERQWPITKCHCSETHGKVSPKRWGHNKIKKKKIINKLLKLSLEVEKNGKCVISALRLKFMKWLLVVFKESQDLVSKHLQNALKQRWEWEVTHRLWAHSRVSTFISGSVSCFCEGALWGLDVSVKCSRCLRTGAPETVWGCPTSWAAAKRGVSV